MIDALTKLAKAKEVQNFKLNLDKLETLEGREELEIMMEPLGVRHLKITKTMADI